MTFVCIFIIMAHWNSLQATHQSNDNIHAMHFGLDIK